MFESNEEYCKFGQRRLDRIQEKITDIELATFDNRPPKVTFEEMIQAGYFKIGECLYYADKPYFHLMADGKISRRDETPCDIHSAIARVKKSSAGRLNGWDYWQVKRDSVLVPINDIRQKYIEEVKSHA